MELKPDAALLYPPDVLLTRLLRDVSRTFYWTLRVLPASIRQQIGLAYLLARTTDTIADTEIIPLRERLAALDELRRRICSQEAEGLDLNRFIEAQPTAAGNASVAERVLLERIPQMLRLLKQLNPHDQKFIIEVLTIITSGQELDLKRFTGATAEHIVALEEDKDLDDYTYRVAGCVGEFWTRMCRAHVFPLAALDVELLLRHGVRFGKGLQLVNILRDLPRDLRQGRCYIPSQSLAQHGFAPKDLLNPENDTRFRPLYNSYLETAESHLAAGWEYTNMLPSGARRVRLACAWPILIGIKTIWHLRRENVLDPAKKVKISRKDVKGIMLGSLFALYCPPVWRGLFEKYRRG